MDELKFVFKGLGFAILVTVLLQFKVGGETLEIKSDRMLHHSAIGIFLNQTAEGAVEVFRKGTQFSREFWASTLGRSDKSTAQAK